MDLNLKICYKLHSSLKTILSLVYIMPSSKLALLLKNTNIVVKHTQLETVLSRLKIRFTLTIYDIHKYNDGINFVF